MPFTIDSINKFLASPFQKAADEAEAKILQFRPKLVEKSDEPVIVGVTTLKVRTNDHYTFTWTVGHYDDDSTTPDAFKEFTDWYNSPRPDQVAAHYVMRYSKGETMVRRADIISYDLRYEEQ